MCSTSIIGSNCCGCDQESSDHLRFNCNEITNNHKDFSIDLSDIILQYTNVEKKSFVLDPINNVNDKFLSKNNFFIFKSKLPLSLYDLSKNVTNLNLFCEVTEIVENDYNVDIKYRIKKIFSENYSISQNNGENIVINQKDFIQRFYSSSFTVPLFVIPDDVYYSSLLKYGEYHLIPEKSKSILKSPNENFDLSSYKWNEEFEYNGVTFKLVLSISDVTSVTETYFSSFDVNGSILSNTQNISYTNRWLKIESVSVNMSESVYENLSIKHSPEDMLAVRNSSNDTINSYYSIALFGHNKRKSISNFGMIPNIDDFILVNENNATNKVEFIGTNL